MILSRRAGLALGLAIVLIAIAAAIAWAVAKDSTADLPVRPVAERPKLMLLTALPIVFPERLTLDAPESPALKLLRGRYRVIPISVTDASTLDDNGLLLMAQPRAQPAQALVDLDQWVRDGGHVLLLADPALEWPSERPLGDLLRAPFAFADTGLLAHWGLKLDAPEKLGSETRSVGGGTLQRRSPGHLVSTSRACAVSRDGLVAHCRIGRGLATVIADADFVSPGQLQDHPANRRLLLLELQRLER